MALTRQAYAHAKYPWEYSTAELSSLFGITRSNALLTAGPMNDSGWTDAVKMLEQQLRFLSYIAWKREENFNTNEGNVTCLYTGRGVPSYAVDTITHSGGTLNRLRHWINWLRSDYGLPAWSWSSDFVAGRAVARLNHVKEMWYATGLLHVNVDWDSSKRTIDSDPYRLFASPEDYNWGNYSGFAPYTYWHLDESWYSRQRTLAFDEATRTTSTTSLVLLAVSNPTGYGMIYSGDETWALFALSELSNAETAFLDNSTCVSGPTGFGGSVYGTTGTGFNCTWKAIDITTHHPTSGSGNVYYKAAMTIASTDVAVFVDPFDGSVSYTPVYLWQTPTSNPY